MRRTTTLGVGESLDRAANELRLNGVGLVPVVEELTLVGVVTEAALARALAEGAELSDSVRSAMVDGTTIQPYRTAAEALRVMATGPDSTLVVVDDFGRLMGLLSASDLYPRRHVAPRPAAVGGMATPFGVYLTTGTVSAGAGTLALMATGACMFALLTVASILASFAVDPMANWQWPTDVVTAINAVLTFGLFGLFMRLVPLSGIHASEHMTVHAIERDEEMLPNIIARMPRIHPRCGTNLAAGALIFLTLFSWEWVPITEVRFMVAALATLYFWRPIGSLLQKYVTTKRPTPKQIIEASAVGQQLLDRYATSRHATASPLRRLLGSGMLQVMAGSFLTALVAMGVGELLSRFAHISIPVLGP